MTTVKHSMKGDIAWIEIDDGKANAIDPDFLRGLNEGMDFAEKQQARAIVISGRPGYFSAGLNLKKLPMLPPDEFMAFCYGFGDVLLRLFAYPRPTIALVRGHAMAGGAVLLIACDYRVAAQGSYKIGMNESAISLPLPSFCVEMAQAVINPRDILPTVLEGNTFDPNAALRNNYITHISMSHDPDAMIAPVLEQIARFSVDAYGTTKGRLRNAIRERGERTCRSEFDSARAMPGMG